MSNSYVPGDCLIDYCTITAAAGTLDVTTIMQMFYMYEDCTVPGISCEITLLESAELHDYLPLVGEEYLNISYSAPGLPSFTHTFYLTEMRNRNPTAQLKNSAYTLMGVAVEVLKNKTTLVNKIYKTNNDAMVRDLFTSYLGSGKPLVTEPTQGIQDYTVTTRKPMTAIMDILARSVAETHQSSSYLFYEDHNGYNFVTLEQLCGQGSVASFTNYEVVADSIGHNSYRNIISYSLPEVYRVADKLSVGAFASIVKKYDFGDLLYGNLEVIPNVQSMVRTMPALFSSPSFKSQWTTPAYYHFTSLDSIKSPTNINTMLPLRTAYAAELDQLRIVARIYMDSSLTVGQVITLNLMQTTSETGPREADTLLAGNYLISKLSTVILPIDVRPTATQILELVSGGLATTP